MKNTQHMKTTAIDRTPAVIIMPYQTAMMQSDLTKTQIDVIVIAMTMLQQLIRALLNRELTLKEALRRLTESNGAGHNLLRFPLRTDGKELSIRELTALTEATKTPNSGIRIVPDNEGKAGWLYMTAGTAAYLLDLSKGYFYVSPQLCRAMRSRYAVRLYWLMQAHCHQGGFTMSIAQLRAIICPNTTYRSYAHFERNVIAQPLATLQKYFSSGLLPTYMLICRLYNRQGNRYWEAAGTTLRGSGRPDALKFTIIPGNNAAPACANTPQPVPIETAPAKPTENTQEQYPEKLPTIASPQQPTSPQNDIILSLLCDDLQLPEKLAEREALRVTDGMRQQFVNHAIMLKEIIDEKHSRKLQLKNQTAYVLTCLHRFFEKLESKAETANSEKKQVEKTMKPEVFEGKSTDNLPMAKATTADTPVAKGVSTNQPAADGNSGNTAPTADEKGKKVAKRSEKEMRHRWQVFLSSYSGKATAALGRARLVGQLRDGFLVAFTSKDDEQAFRCDFDAVQQAARRALDISCRFQPGLIVNR